MARVPFQQNLQVEQQAGSEVQFGATSVEPMKDFVTDDIERSAKALQQTGQIIQKLDNELNDAEAKRLYNGLHADIEIETNKYTSLKGANAVLPNGQTPEGKNKTAFDDTNKNFETILKTYTDQSSNGTVKYMLENMAQVSIKSAQAKITQHSLTQQRIFKEKETEAKIDNHQLDAIKSITRFNDAGGEHWVSFGSGIVEIQSFAIDKGWNIDPSKGEVSAQYLNMIKEYTSEIHNEAVKWFKDNNQQVLGKQYFAKHAEGFVIGDQQIVTVDGETVVTGLAELQKSENEYCAVKICDNVLSYEGNSNNNNFLHSANFLLKLDSNSNIDNGNGSSIIDGFNADLMPNLNATKSENIEQLQQIRATSKYYSIDSPLYEQIIPQHRTAHLFAIQKLGVEKADSLYTNAIKDANIDKEKYNNDPKYFVEVNKKVMANFNKAFLAEIEIAYTPKVQELNKKITKLKNTPDLYNKSFSSLGPIPGTKDYKNSQKDSEKRNKIKQLENEIKIVKNQADTYVDTITNDLLVINEDIDYEYVNGKEYVQVNPKTNLPPLTYYEKQIKDTIKDPVKQEHALTELRFKYNKIDKERTELYNIAYTQAEDIAFSEPDGWKMLKANGIDINSFTLEDQKILKSGQPAVSDEDAIHEIETNDVEVLQDETKLKSFRHKLNPGDYEYYVNQLNGNKSNKTKSAGIKVDTEIFNSGLRDHNLDKLVDASSGSKDAIRYDKLKMKFRDRLNFYYENGIEITYDKRKSILKEILTDDVIYDGNFRDNTKPLYATKDKDFDRLYVNVDDETVYLNDIPFNVKSEIMKYLLINGEPLTYENIAEQYVTAGRPKNTDAYKKGLKIDMMRGN